MSWAIIGSDIDLCLLGAKPLPESMLAKYEVNTTRLFG